MPEGINPFLFPIASVNTKAKESQATDAVFIPVRAIFLTTMVTLLLTTIREKKQHFLLLSRLNSLVVETIASHADMDEENDFFIGGVYFSGTRPNKKGSLTKYHGKLAHCRKTKGLALTCKPSHNSAVRPLVGT